MPFVGEESRVLLKVSMRLALQTRSSDSHARSHDQISTPLASPNLSPLRLLLSVLFPLLAVTLGNTAMKRGSGR